jgi:hypothetical protein
MPVLPDDMHCWTRTLHWLAWAGFIMGADRWGEWNGMNVPYDRWDESNYGPRPQSFYSVIDNLFLRSAAAIEWLIGRIEATHLTTDKQKTSSTVATQARSRKRGRPSDTNVPDDRRVSEAWETGLYESIEALARALGRPKPDVRKALDRHRHRKGKNARRNMRQDP